MGLPRRKVDNPGTIFGIEVDEPRWSLDPRLRRDMAEEQQLSMQEQALDAQQQYLQRQQRVAAAEDAAIAGIESGEEIGNIFQKNPSLALSRNFGQFANMAEMVRPSKAAQSMIPSLAMKLPIEERGVFNELVNQPQFANNPFAAYDEAQRRGSRSKQHGELVKAGVPLAKIDQTKDYSPVEFQDLINQNTAQSRDPRMASMEKYLDYLQKQEESLISSQLDQIPNPQASDKDPSIPKFIPSPEFLEIQKEKSDIGSQYRNLMRSQFAPKEQKAAANITSPAAMGGAPVPFMDTMKKGAGQAPKVDEVIPPITLQEELEDIKSISDDPNALIEVVRSGSRSPEAKKAALEKLKEFQRKLPTFEFKTGTPEQISEIKRNISGMVEEAKSEIELEPFKQEVNKAWTTEKKNMQSQIKDFAKAIGVSPELAESWLAQNVTYTTEFDPTSDAMPRKVAIRDYFDEYLQNRVGKSLRDEADIITRLSGNKYASKLGIGKSKLAKGLISQVLAPFIGPFAYSEAANIAPEKGPTYGRMLDAYLGEKFGQNQPTASNSVAPAVKPSNIKSITPIE